MTDMTVRNVRPEDLPQIIALEELCFSDPWPENILRAHLTDGHIFLAAVEGEQVLGYAGLLYVLDEGCITNVATAPARRREGIAGMLLSALKERARELNLAFLTLEVRESNFPARRLYEKHGFTDVGRRKGYYECPREDAILMTYFFS